MPKMICKEIQSCPLTEAANCDWVYKRGPFWDKIQFPTTPREV